MSADARNFSKISSTNLFELKRNGKIYASFNLKNWRLDFQWQPADF